MLKSRVTGVVMLIIFIITSSTMAQETGLECSERCYKPELSLVKGDVMTWEFENIMIQDDDVDILVEPQVLSEVTITLLKPLNGLFDSVISDEFDYLKVIASISFAGNNTIKNTQIPIAKLPSSVFIATMVTIRGSLVNFFEYSFTDNADWQYDRTFLNRTSITTNYYISHITVINGIYTYSKTSRTESRVDENIFTIFTEYTEQWEVDTGLLISLNSTTWSQGSSPKTTLIRMVEFSPFEELGINMELLLYLMGGILIIATTFAVIYLYFHRRRR